MAKAPSPTGGTMGAKGAGSKSAKGAKPKSARGAGRRGRTLPIAALLPAVTRKALGRRGFASAAVITEWAHVVGPELARESIPERLVFPHGKRDSGVLWIRVDGPLATELAHLEPLVLERINASFGYRAVAGLRLRQGPVTAPSGDSPEPSRPLPPSPPSLPPEQRRALASRLHSVADTELRASLQRLGEAVLTHNGVEVEVEADASADPHAAAESGTDSDYDRRDGVNP